MVVLELMEQVRATLQDDDANYWSDTELLSYYGSGVKSIASERIESPTTTTVTLITDTYEYSISGVLRYMSIEDSDGISRPLYADDGTGDNDPYGVIIKDYDRIYVNTPLDTVTLTINHITLPQYEHEGDTVRDSDENALKYYMLSKAYEKEQETENFQKAQYFMTQFREALKLLLTHSKVGYVKGATVTTGYFY